MQFPTVQTGKNGNWKTLLFLVLALPLALVRSGSISEASAKDNQKTTANAQTGQAVPKKVQPPASSETWLYPEQKPFNEFRLKVSKIHELYVAEYGNPKGEPVLIVHGGPGAGGHPIFVRHFDLKHWRVVMVDQRGAGKSTPHGEIKENDTWKLAEDFETVRKRLNIKKWMVFGGSWGSFLGLAYAETYPQHVSKVILRAQMLGLTEENDWLYGGKGFHMLFPGRWKVFRDHIPPEERSDLLTAYFKRLNHPDEKVRKAATWAWRHMDVMSIQESAMPKPEDLPKPEEITAEDARGARLECHYFMNNAFAKPEDQLLRNAHRLKGVPVVIINGQYDMPCPPSSAIKLKEAIPHAELIIIPEAGHSLLEPGISKATMSQIGKLKDTQNWPSTD